MSENAELVPVAPRGLLAPVVTASQMMAAQDSLREYCKAGLTEGLDYGKIPGTPTPTLLKPGTEKLLAGFGLYAEPDLAETKIEMLPDHVNRQTLTRWVDMDKPDESTCDRMQAARTGRWRKDGGDWQWQEAVTEEVESIGLYTAVVVVRIIDRATGEVVGTGMGACSTAEEKYIRRPGDAINTVIKMAKKRAVVDGTLSTLGLSGMFTQDLEELPHDLRGGDGHSGGQKRRGSRQSNRSRDREQPGRADDAPVHMRAAKREGTCESCRETIAVGEPQYWRKATQEVWHEECWESRDIDAAETDLDRELAEDDGKDPFDEQ